jgi:hypothetical protein
MHFARLGAAFMAELAKGQLGPAAEHEDGGNTPPAPAVDPPTNSDDGCSLKTGPSSKSASTALLSAMLLILLIDRKWLRRDRLRRASSHGARRELEVRAYAAKSK